VPVVVVLVLLEVMAVPQREPLAVLDQHKL
jgi:hypothetical protein